MSVYNILNLVFFQAVWFSCVIGAGVYGEHWLPTLAIAALALLAWRGPFRSVDFNLAAVGTCAGLFIDNLWVGIDMLGYQGGQFAPYWIALLWVGFSLTINHSMSFLRDRTLIGSVIVGIFAPFSYLAAERFGAVSVNSTWQLAFISLAWFITFYGLARYAKWLLQAGNQSQLKETIQ